MESFSFWVDFRIDFLYDIINDVNGNTVDDECSSDGYLLIL